jgi:hypothetical protein
MKKTVIRLTEADLHKIIKESVRRVLKEGMISPDKWRYQGDKADKYMWALKKDAEKKGEVREDGWPSGNYLQRWYNYANDVTDGGMEASFVGSYDDSYGLSELWSLVDHFLYHCQLRFGNDVLDRPSQNKYRSWFITKQPSDQL